MACSDPLWVRKVGVTSSQRAISKALHRAKLGLLPVPRLFMRGAFDLTKADGWKVSFCAKDDCIKPFQRRLCNLHSQFLQLDFALCACVCVSPVDPGVVRTHFWSTDRSSRISGSCQLRVTHKCAFLEGQGTFPQTNSNYFPLFAF